MPKVMRRFRLVLTPHLLAFRWDAKSSSFVFAFFIMVLGLRADVVKGVVLSVVFTVVKVVLGVCFVVSVVVTVVVVLRVCFVVRIVVSSSTVVSSGEEFIFGSGVLEVATSDEKILLSTISVLLVSQHTFGKDFSNPH
jgi:hypothetical protein